MAAENLFLYRSALWRFKKEIKMYFAFEVYFPVYFMP